MYLCEGRGSQITWQSETLLHCCARGHINRPTITSSVSSSKGIYGKWCFAIIHIFQPSHKRPLYFLNSCIIHIFAHFRSMGRTLWASPASGFGKRAVLFVVVMCSYIATNIKEIVQYMAEGKSGKVDIYIIHYPLFKSDLWSKEMWLHCHCSVFTTS